MLDFLKENLRLSHLTCILALVTPGTVLLFVPPVARWGRRWMAAVVIFYWVLSSPVGAGLLARSLIGGGRPVAAGDEGRGAGAGGGVGGGSINVRAAGRQISSVTADVGLRVIEAARLLDMLKGSVVIASGGIT